jgi:xylulokinase
MYLGIDVGTSAVKVMLIEDDRRVADAADAAEAPLEVSRPQPGWSEQNPDDWIRATQAAVAALDDRRRLAAVRGIGLSGQMHGATLLDEHDRPLRPCK